MTPLPEHQRSLVFIHPALTSLHLQHSCYQVAVPAWQRDPSSLRRSSFGCVVGWFWSIYSPSGREKLSSGESEDLSHSNQLISKLNYPILYVHGQGKTSIYLLLFIFPILYEANTFRCKNRLFDSNKSQTGSWLSCVFSSDLQRKWWHHHFCSQKHRKGCMRGVRCLHISHTRCRPCCWK